MRSNCWIVAKLLYWRLLARGREAYFAKRNTRLGKRIRFSHYLVMWRLPSGYVHTVSFKPIHRIKRWLPPPLFRGRIVWGDWPDAEVSADVPAVP